MIGANKHIFAEHLLDLMRLIYAFFILLPALMASALCQQTAEDWKNNGNSLIVQGKYDEAIHAYEEAIWLDPYYAKAWCNKGIALNALGKYDEAIQAFNESIRLDPN